MIATAETRRRGATRPDRSIVLCTSQRSGSTLLCDLLTSTDLLGYPKEMFLDRAWPAFADAWGLPIECDHAEFLQHGLVDGTSPNGVHATKVMWDQVGTLFERTCGLGIDALPSPVPVLLRRGDKVAAAVSEWRAERTGRWSADDASPSETVPRFDDDDLYRIGALHDRKHAEERAWRAYLDEIALPMVDAVYEDWSCDPGELVDTIADAVGVDLGDAQPRSGLRRQRDAGSERVARAWEQSGRGCAECRP